MYDLPIVTMATQLMRGRHTAAMLQQMGMHEFVAESIEQYVDIAVQLASDATWRAVVKDKIRERKHCLYRDQAPVRALEDFLDSAVRTQRAPN